MSRKQGRREEIIVTLTDEERAELQGLLAGGKASVLKQASARILLKVDVSPGGPGWSDSKIAETVEVGPATGDCTTSSASTPSVRLRLPSALIDVQQTAVDGIA